MIENGPLLDIRWDRTARRAVLCCVAVLAAAWSGVTVDYVRQHLAFAAGERREAPPAPAARMEPDTLLLPSLGIAAPLQYVAHADERAFQEALQRGVVHYPGTALPGRPGNAYYFGHSSDYAWTAGEYKTVFALLPQIARGDEIVVSDAAGTPFRYHVVEKKVVSPKDLSVLDQGDGGTPLLTLQTSYPLGTALRRYIVVAELAAD